MIGTAGEVFVIFQIFIALFVVVFCQICNLKSFLEDDPFIYITFFAKII